MGSRVSGNDINATVNNAVICYDDAGEGNIPLIFIHGFPFDKSQWLPQAEYFKKITRVICYDISGFGKSQRAHAHPTINLFADELIDFMDLLEIKKAIVCGLSMGGYIVLNAVSKYSERFAALVLCDTQCIADTSETREKRKAATTKIKNGQMKEYVEDTIKSVFTVNAVQANDENVKHIREVIQSTAEDTLTSTLHALAEREETCSILNEITIPVLILCGAEDKITPVEKAQYLADNITGAQIKTIDGAAHLSNLENPTEFNRNVKHFVEGLVV